jgi:hypothetical protein
MKEGRMIYWARVFEDRDKCGIPGRLLFVMDLGDAPNLELVAQRLGRPIGTAFGTFLELWMESQIVTVNIIPTLNMDEYRLAVTKYSEANHG